MALCHIQAKKKNLCISKCSVTKTGNLQVCKNEINDSYKNTNHLHTYSFWNIYPTLSLSLSLSLSIYLSIYLSICLCLSVCLSLSLSIYTYIYIYIYVLSYGPERLGVIVVNHDKFGSTFFIRSSKRNFKSAEPS